MICVEDFLCRNTLDKDFPIFPCISLRSSARTACLFYLSVNQCGIERVWAELVNVDLLFRSLAVTLALSTTMVSAAAAICLLTPASPAVSILPLLPGSWPCTSARPVSFAAIRHARRLSSRSAAWVLGHGPAGAVISPRPRNLSNLTELGGRSL